jgi:hypothetical protein
MAIEEFPENALGIYNEPTWAESPTVAPVAPTTGVAAAGHIDGEKHYAVEYNYLWREQSRWTRALAHRTPRSDLGLIGSYVQTGGTYPTMGGTLSVQLPLTEVWIDGVLSQFADPLVSPHVFTASRDSYLIVDADGARTETEVANGAGVPAVVGTQVIVSKTVTDGTQVTTSTLSLTDVPTLGEIGADTLSVAGGCEVGGTLEVRGATFLFAALDLDTNSITNVDNVGCETLAVTSSIDSATIATTGNVSIGGSLNMTAGAISNVTTLSANDVTIATLSYHSVRGSTVLGSTNTMIYRWTSVADNSGTDIVYTDSGTDGGSWAIAVSGIYSVSMSIDSGHAGYIAIKKAAALNNTFDVNDIMAVGEAAVGIAMSLSWTGFCAAGSDIWIAANSATNPTGSPVNNQRCSVTRVR